MGKIADTIYEELSYMYCDNCRHSSEITDEDEYGENSHCEGCYRKYSNWAVSKETAEHIEELCKGDIDNLEKHSYIEGYKAGCEEGKKCYERPKGEWIELSNYKHKCSVCNNLADILANLTEQLSDFCPNCGADMRGGKGE